MCYDSLDLHYGSLDLHYDMVFRLPEPEKEGLDVHALLAGHLENCGITEFVFRGFDGRFFLNRFNDYAHLEAYPKLLRKGWSGKR